MASLGGVEDGQRKGNPQTLGWVFQQAVGLVMESLGRAAFQAVTGGVGAQHKGGAQVDVLRGSGEEQGIAVDGVERDVVEEVASRPAEVGGDEVRSEERRVGKECRSRGAP